MSVDTKEWRERASDGRYVVNVACLCDEIDRLRKEADDAKNLYALSNGSFQEENEKLRSELAALRDRQRPRSIKDEPPPLSKDILVWKDAAGAWLKGCVLDREAVFRLTDKFWMPQPPAPPEPDPFEVWFDSFCKGDSSIACHREDCRFAWDAALSSVKKDANPR